MKTIPLFLMPFFCCLAFTQQKDSIVNTKKTLTGNWYGTRPWLSEKGIDINPRVTTFTEAAFQNNKEISFGGKADLAININAEKLGLWKDLNIITHTEFNFGNSQNGTSGSILPQNTAMLLPGSKNEKRLDITSLYFLQKIETNKTLMIGKINMVDIASGTKFIGGAGIDTFEHIAFVAPPSGLVPPYLFGALFSIKTQKLNYTFGLYDPISAVNKSGLEKPFNKGVTFYSSFEKPVKIFGKTGSHTIKAAFSTQNGIDLASLSDIIIDPELISSADTKKNRYYIGYSFHQYIVQNPDNTDNGWGIFGNIGVSDTNPTPLDWSFIIGVGGKSLFKNRDKDRWGIGFFHQSFSNSLRNQAAILQKNLDDENGIEAFYNYQVSSFFNLGLNTKLLKPAINNNNQNFFIGFKTSFKL